MPVTIIKEDAGFKIQKGKHFSTLHKPSLDLLKAACRDALFSGFEHSGLIPEASMISKETLESTLRNGIRKYGEMYEFIDFPIPVGERKKVSETTNKLILMHFTEFLQGDHSTVTVVTQSDPVIVEAGQVKPLVIPNDPLFIVTGPVYSDGSANKVALIKLYRETFNLNLKESKDFVDANLNKPWAIPEEKVALFKLNAKLNKVLVTAA